MVARSKDGQVTSYPVTETVHRSSICYVTQTPAQIPQELQDQAKEIAEKTVSCLEGEDCTSCYVTARIWSFWQGHNFPLPHPCFGDVKFICNTSQRLCVLGLHTQELQLIVYQQEVSSQSKR